jgi:DNA-binding transcriptional LysR family regulator
LSAEGQRLAITVNEAYGSIDAELRRLDAGMISGILRVRSIPSFLSKWLTPRLPRLQQRYPDIQLRLVAEDSSVPLHEGDFDLAIDLNDGSYPGCYPQPCSMSRFSRCARRACCAGARRCMGRRIWCISAVARHHRLARQL